jgi:hypothetical protein
VSSFERASNEASLTVTRIPRQLTVRPNLAVTPTIPRQRPRLPTFPLTPTASQDNRRLANRVAPSCKAEETLGEGLASVSAEI